MSRPGPAGPRAAKPFLRTGSVFASMRRRRGSRSLTGMRYFLVEIPMPQIGPRDSARAAEALRAAQSRLCGRATVPRARFAGISHQDDRLICLIEASAAQAARALVTLALLPTRPIREISN